MIFMVSFFSFHSALPTVLDLGIAFVMSPISPLPVLNAQKEFVKNLLNAFTISNTDTRLGFMKYGREAKIVYTLRELTSLRNAYVGLDDITLDNPGYNMLSVLKQAKTKFFQPSFGARQNAPKSLFIFNNGASGILESDLKEEADALRDMGVKIVVLGVGGDTDPDELKVIASNRDAYFFVDDLPNINRYLNPITTQLQPGKLK